MSILPDANLGIFGGGQLGRMFVVAARAMGYSVTVFDPDQSSPAGHIADEHLCAAYDDELALQHFAEVCAAITVEFENVPGSALQYVSDKARLSPDPMAFSVAQNRILEKQFLNEAGVETVRFREVHTRADIEDAFAVLRPPLILKTTRFGYDGRGQCPASTQAQAEAFFASGSSDSYIFEEKAELMCEVSVIVVRDYKGNSICYPVAENEHREGILHTSIVPARVDSGLSREVQTKAKQIVERLNYHGVLGVEFFITTDGRVLANEIAPRPHNSGHYTIDACNISQFTQQLRVMCELPLTPVRLLSPVVMVNILGDAWRDGKPPNWNNILSEPNANLHLYGKKAARAGRKMGHFCLLGKDIDTITERAEDMFGKLMS